jgi:hypothetical protein
MRRSGLFCPVSLALLAVAGAAGSAAAAAGPQLQVRAAELTQTDATTWTGAVSSKQLGKGQLRLTGKVTFLPKESEHPPRTTLRFHATFKKGTLDGCFLNGMFLRPGNRQVWDGPGRITKTSSALRSYRGLSLREGGLTMTDDLQHAKPFSFATRNAPSTPPRC